MIVQCTLQLKFVHIFKYCVADAIRRRGRSAKIARKQTRDMMPEETGIVSQLRRVACCMREVVTDASIMILLNLIVGLA